MIIARPRSRPRWPVVTSFVGAFTMAVLAFWLSFTALSDLSRQAGLPHRDAWMWPLIIDGLIVVSTVAVVARAPHGRRATAYPWTVLAIGSVASIMANVFHALRNPANHLGAGGAVMAAAPPLVLLIVTHLAVKLANNAAAEQNAAVVRPKLDPRADEAPRPSATATRPAVPATQRTKEESAACPQPTPRPATPRPSTRPAAARPQADDSDTTHTLPRAQPDPDTKPDPPQTPAPAPGERPVNASLPGTEPAPVSTQQQQQSAATSSPAPPTLPPPSTLGDRAEQPQATHLSAAEPTPRPTPVRTDREPDDHHVVTWAAQAPQFDDRQQHAFRRLAEGGRPTEIAEEIQVDRKTIRRWRTRAAEEHARHAPQAEYSGSSV